jgi:hypothetical protein
MEAPNLAMIPSGVKATKLYSIMPESGVGDFTFARASTAYRLNKDGLWETSASNLPRLHYDLSNGNPDSCPCLLLEPASTNALGYSELFSSWGTTRSTIVADSIMSPDGTVNASKMKDDGSTGTDTSQRFLSVIVANGLDYTFSVFAKKGSMDFVALRTGNFTNGGGTGETFFNLATGVVGTTYVSHTASIEKYPNGWYRCSIKFTAGTDLSGTVLIRQASANGTSTVPLDGNSFIYLWGAQFEQNSFATSYIKTTSNISSTRSAETCNSAGDASTFNSEQGILFLEVAALINDATVRLWSLSNGTTLNRVFLGFGGASNNIRFRVQVANVYQAEDDTTISDVTAFNKIALLYKENNFKLYINGSLALSDTSGSTFTSGTLDRFNFDSAAGSSIPYSKCKDLRYYDTEGMTDTEIDNLLTQLTQ